MLREFREFAMRGSVIDMAIGIVIGMAFGKIVTSLVNDLIMPPLGLLLGDMDFASLFIALDGESYGSLAAAKAAGAATLNYGVFLNQVLDFILVAFAAFLLVRWVNRMKLASLTQKPCPHCLSIINAKATRCPHCTAELPEPDEPPGDGVRAAEAG